MLGGAGDDTYVVDSVGDLIIESPGTGIETVIASVNWDLRRENPNSPTKSTGLDHLTLTGNATNGIGNELNNTIIGNDSANQLAGNEGNDKLYGNGGNDRLIGGFAGFQGDDNDYLDGGAGDDTLFGGNGNDTYVVDSLGDRIIESPGTGIETVLSSALTWDLRRENPNSAPKLTGLDNLTLIGLGAINGTGNELNNIMTGNDSANTLAGNEGNDRLFGNGGNDRLIGGFAGFQGDDNDYLDGGAGDDTLFGGNGNDTYVVDSLGDRILESPGTGIETVLSSALTWDLRRENPSSTLKLTGLDNLTLTGGALNGTGNELNNTIIGNSNDNSLNGMEGNDTLRGADGKDTLSGLDGNDFLVGGLGSDRLFGGSGQDTFYYASSNEGGDDILSFSVADDTIQVLRSGFSQTLAIGTLNASQFTLGSAATNSSQRFIYNPGTGGLFFDADGLGGAAQNRIATLTTGGVPGAGGINLTNNDIQVVA